MTTNRAALPATLTLTACGALAVAATAGASDLRFAVGYPSSAAAVQVAERYADALEDYSDGDLTTTVYPMTLLNAQETSDGVRDGMADIGFLLTVYFPSRYPHTNFLNESAMQLQLLEDPETVRDLAPMAFQAAMAEYTLFHCPECLEEYEAQNQIYTANATSVTYGLLCTDPVTSPDDIDGQRIRVAGSHWARWTSALGGSSVSLSVNEILEGLDQGVIDCTISDLPVLDDLALIDVVTDINLDVPGGLYAGANAASYNADRWRGLSESEREAVLRAGAMLTADSAITGLENQEKGREMADEAGITFHEADDELLEATRDFVEADMDELIGYYEDNHDMQDAEAMLETFHELVNDWMDKVDGIEDRDSLEALYWEEIFSRVDVSSHGM